MKLGKIAEMKKLFVAVLFVFVSSSLFAVEEYVSLIYKQIDTAFTERNSDNLDEILKDNINDKYYYLIENYTQKKIRHLILNNDYDFAKETTLVVIDNNLDNTDAVEMYSLIIESYEIQKEAERKRALAEQEEQERIEQQMEKARTSTEKTYVGSTTADGKSVYVSAEKDMNFTRYQWKANFGLVNFASLGNPYNALNYGISAAGSYEYAFVDYSIGADLFLGINFLNLNGSEANLFFPFEIAPRISLTQLSRKVFFRAGFSEYLISVVSGSERSNAHFLSPLFGVMLDDVALGPVSVSVGFDYLMGHLFYEDMLFAGGVNASLEVPFKELEKTKLYFSVGIKDKFIISKTNGMDNRLNLILAVGGQNVIR